MVSSFMRSEEDTGDVLLRSKAGYVATERVVHRNVMGKSDNKWNIGVPQKTGALYAYFTFFASTDNGVTRTKCLQPIEGNRQ